MAEPHVLSGRQSVHRQRQRGLFLKPCSQGRLTVPKPQHRLTLAALQGSCRARQLDPSTHLFCPMPVLDFRFYPLLHWNIPELLPERRFKKIRGSHYFETQHALLLLWSIQTIIWFQSCGQRSRMLEVSLQVFLLPCAAWSRLTL